jgi:hypothetical protein
MRKYSFSDLFRLFNDCNISFFEYGITGDKYFDYYKIEGDIDKLRKKIAKEKRLQLVKSKKEYAPEITSTVLLVSKEKHLNKLRMNK